MVKYFLMGWLGISSAVGAAGTVSYGTQAMPMMGQLSTARNAALGGAFDALAQGPDAMFGNPAGLAGQTQLDMGLHHENWLADISQDTMYVVTPVTPSLALGGYGHLINYGVFEIRDDNGMQTGDMTARDYAVGLSVGLKLGLGLQWGGTLRVAREALYQENDFNYSADTGITWDNGQAWVVGLSVVNLGINTTGAIGSASARLGVSRKAVWDNAWIWPAVGAEMGASGFASVDAGLEGRVNNALDLRAGYIHPFFDTLIEGLQGLTLGLGMRAGQFTLDYAFLPYGDLGAGHRLSLSWHQAVTLEQPSRQAPPEPTVVMTPPPLPMVLPPSGLPPMAPPLLSAPTPTLVPTPNAALQYHVDLLANAKALENEGRLGEALAEYQRVAAEHPDLLGAWRGLADLSYRLGNKARAVPAFEKVLELKPDDDLKAWLNAYRRGGQEQ